VSEALYCMTRGDVLLYVYLYIYGLSAVESTRTKLSGVDFRMNNRDKRVTTTISGRIYPALLTVDLYAL